MIRKIIKQIYSVMLAMVMVTAVLPIIPASADEPAERSLLSKAYYDMEKAKFNSSIFRFGELPDFKEGVLDFKIKDLDSDGQLEMLVLRLKFGYDGYEYEYPCILAGFEVYEIESGNVYLADVSDFYPFITAPIYDAGGLEFFLKDDYIAFQCALQCNTDCDGATQYINIYKYNGSKLEKYIEWSIEGSSLEEEGDKIFNLLQSVGFYANFDYYDPYFLPVGGTEEDRELIFDLSNIDGNVDKISEVIVFNNSYDVAERYGYEELAQMEVMTVKINRIYVYFNDMEIKFDQPPIIENGRTLVPLRAIFEALGAAVNWDENTQTVTATGKGTNVTLQIGSNQMWVNNEVKILDVPAQIKGGRTLVPVRAISEAFGCSVSWDGDLRQVIISE